MKYLRPHRLLPSSFGPEVAVVVAAVAVVVAAAAAVVVAVVVAAAAFEGVGPAPLFVAE